MLDSAIEKLMAKEEIQSLYSIKKPTLEQIKYQRKSHFAYEILQKDKSIHHKNQIENDFQLDSEISNMGHDIKRFALSLHDPKKES